MISTITTSVPPTPSPYWVYLSVGIPSQPNLRLDCWNNLLTADPKLQPSLSKPSSTGQPVGTFQNANLSSSLPLPPENLTVGSPCCQRSWQHSLRYPAWPCVVQPQSVPLPQLLPVPLLSAFWPYFRLFWNRRGEGRAQPLQEWHGHRTWQKLIRINYSVQDRYFPGSSVAKTSSSNAGGTGSILGQGTKIPHASWPKSQNIK